MSKWVRVQANMALGANDISEATKIVADPVWPDYTHKEIIRIAVRDRLINSFDHPVLKQLRGDV
jgi:hypothetical protein